MQKATHLNLKVCKKTYVSTQEIIQEYKLCELRYRPIGTMFFTQEYIYYFQYKKERIFNIYHLLFPNQ